MAINPEIALGIRRQPLESPINKMAQVMQLQGMRDEAAQRQMGMQRQNKLLELMDATYEKPEMREEALLRGGFVKEANDLTKNRVDAARVQADTDKNKIDAAHKRVDSWGQAMGFVRQNPTVENAQAAVQHLVTMGVMPAEMAQSAVASLQADPTPEGVARFADMGFRAALAAKDQLPKIEVRNIGGQTITQAADPLTGRTAITGAVQNTQSPDSAASVAATIRGQNMVDQRARERLDFERGNAVADAGGPNQAALVKRLGKPPAGYRWKDDGTMEAVPGGPADIKAGEVGAKRARQIEGAIGQANRVIGKVDEALGKVGMTTAGVGSVLSKIPGTDARDLQSALDTIKANLGFAELQAMRDASPTGGALGAIAVQELIALQSTVASLDQAQSPAQLKQSLDQIKKHYTNWRKTLQGSDEVSPTPGGGGNGKVVDFGSLR